MKFREPQTMTAVFTFLASASLSLAALAGPPPMRAPMRVNAPASIPTVAKPATTTTKTATTTKTTTTTKAPTTQRTGQPNQSCGSATAPETPGHAAAAPGSAFNPNGTAGGVYAGQQPQNSVNPKSVSQYDVACSHQK